MTFLEQFNMDIANFNFTDSIYYMFCENDVKMMQRIRKHTVFTNFFIYCDSRNRPNKQKVNTEISMYNALIKCGYSIKSENKYFLADIAELKIIERLMKKKYGNEYSSHLASRTYMVKPFLQRYLLKLNDTEILFYYSVYEPITFLKLLSNLKEKVETKWNLGIIIKEFDYWFGADDILQLNSQLMKKTKSSFIISPNKFWHSTGHRKSFFTNWEDDYDIPIDIDKELVISHRKDISKEAKKELEDYRYMRDIGMINE